MYEYNTRRQRNHTQLSKRFEWLDDTSQEESKKQGVEETDNSDRLESKSII